MIHGEDEGWQRLAAQQKIHCTERRGDGGDSLRGEAGRSGRLTSQNRRGRHRAAGHLGDRFTSRGDTSASDSPHRTHSAVAGSPRGGINRRQAHRTGRWQVHRPGQPGRHQAHHQSPSPNTHHQRPHEQPTFGPQRYPKSAASQVKQHQARLVFGWVTALDISSGRDSSRESTSMHISEKSRYDWYGHDL